MIHSKKCNILCSSCVNSIFTIINNHHHHQSLPPPEIHETIVMADITIDNDWEQSNDKGKERKKETLKPST